MLNENAIQFSEKLQYGVPLQNALEIFSKAGQSQISGFTDHPFIKSAKGVEGFLHNWISANYLGDISFLRGEDGTFRQPEIRPLPQELRVYQQVPDLHLLPTVAGTKFYPDVPSLEEIIKKISGTNYWEDKGEGLDTRKTIEKIKKTRTWNGKDNETESGYLYEDIMNNKEQLDKIKKEILGNNFEIAESTDEVYILKLMAKNQKLLKEFKDVGRGKSPT